MGRLLTLCLLWLLPTTAIAQTAGVPGRIGFGARGIAIGNALAGDASGFASPFYNPALAPYLTDQSIGVSAALLTQDRQLQFVELRTPLKPMAGISAGLIHAGVNNIDQRDLSGYHTGMLSTNEYTFFAAFGLRVGQKASIGIGLQLFRNDLHRELSPVQTFGLDLGIGIHVIPSVHLGLVVDDLLAKYTWDTAGSGGRGITDKFPTRLRLGGSWMLLENRLQLLFEYESRFSVRDVFEPEIIFSSNKPQQVFNRRELNLHESHYRVGAEFALVPALVIRAGMSRLEEISDGGPRPSAGFMVEQHLGLLVTQVAYTFVLEPYALGTMHLVTLRFFL